MRVSDERLEELLAQNRYLNSGDISEYSDIIADLQDARAEIDKLKADFACYRETAEEISQCYNNSRSDSWVLESALREIVDDCKGQPPERMGPMVQGALGHAKIALETVWKRREERSIVIKEVNPNET